VPATAAWRRGGDGQSQLAQGQGGARRIETAGAQLLYLPPYSPDLNPIEKAWPSSTTVRAAKARTKDALDQAIANCCRFSLPRMQKLGSGSHSMLYSNRRNALMLPVDQVRAFATWFYKRKCELWNSKSTKPRNIQRHGKEGSSLYTIRTSPSTEAQGLYKPLPESNSSCGGKVIYVGLHKQASVQDHKPLRLYLAVLKEMMKRLNQICEYDARNITSDRHGRAPRASGDPDRSESRDV